MRKINIFAFGKTENFSGEAGVLPLFSEKKKLKINCITNLNQLYEQRRTEQVYISCFPHCNTLKIFLDDFV